MHSLCLGKLYFVQRGGRSWEFCFPCLGQVSGQKRPQIRQVGKWACGGGTNQERNWKCQQKVIRAKSLLPFNTNMNSNKAIKWRTIAKIWLVLFDEGAKIEAEVMELRWLGAKAFLKWAHVSSRRRDRIWQRQNIDMEWVWYITICAHIVHNNMCAHRT